MSHASVSATTAATEPSTAFELIRSSGYRTGRDLGRNLPRRTLNRVNRVAPGCKLDADTLSSACSHNADSLPSSEPFATISFSRRSQDVPEYVDHVHRGCQSTPADHGHR